MALCTRTDFMYSGSSSSCSSSFHPWSCRRLGTCAHMVSVGSWTRALAFGIGCARASPQAGWLVAAARRRKRDSHRGQLRAQIPCRRHVPATPPAPATKKNRRDRASRRLTTQTTTTTGQIAAAVVAVVVGESARRWRASHGGGVPPREAEAWRAQAEALPASSVQLSSRVRRRQLMPNRAEVLFSFRRRDDFPMVPAPPRRPVPASPHYSQRQVRPPATSWSAAARSPRASPTRPTAPHPTPGHLPNCRFSTARN